MPTNRSTRPEKRKVSPGESVSRKSSSILPRAGPPREGLPADLHIADRQIGRLDDGPTLSLYCWASLGLLTRQRPSFVFANPGIALVGAQGVAARGDEIDNAVVGLTVDAGIGSA